MNDTDSISLQYHRLTVYNHYMPHSVLHFSNSDNCLLVISKGLLRILNQENKILRNFLFFGIPENFHFSLHCREL